MTNHYRNGRAFEYRVRDRLVAEGYDVFRTAGSKTKVDLTCVKQGQVLFVQCKRSGLPGPAERRDLVRVARMLPGIGVPVIARGKTLERITDDGTDPKAREPFVLDEVAS